MCVEREDESCIALAPGLAIHGNFLVSLSSRHPANVRLGKKSIQLAGERSRIFEDTTLALKIQRYNSSSRWVSLQ